MFFAFDVDGTLTPSRQRIDPGFERWFKKWMANVQDRGNSVLLVTGSDYPKTVEQLSQEIVDSVDYCCNCLGNQVFHRNKLIHSFEFNPTSDLLDFLETELANSPYVERYGNHIEHRGSMINFSIVGRNAKGDERTRYFEWDKLSCERLALAEKINALFPEVSAQAGGETGIDIIPRGKDKRQVVDYIGDNKTYFFGDRMDDGGNDQPLAIALVDRNPLSECIHVKQWKDTWEVLHDISHRELEMSVHF